jgi:hypothetical protein
MTMTVPPSCCAASVGRKEARSSSTRSDHDLQVFLPGIGTANRREASPGGLVPPRFGGPAVE